MARGTLANLTAVARSDSILRGGSVIKNQVAGAVLRGIFRFQFQDITPADFKFGPFVTESRDEISPRRRGDAEVKGKVAGAGSSRTLRFAFQDPTSADFNVGL